MLESFGQDAMEIQKTIVSELQNIFKWLDVNRLCLNVAKSKFMLFYMPQKEIAQLTFNINGMVIEHVKEFNFLGLILDSNLNWTAHLKAIGSTISRVIGLLRKLKYIFPTYIFCSIYKTLILPHLNYSLLTWGNKCIKLNYYRRKPLG